MEKKVKIITHYNPDLDAVAGALLYKYAKRLKNVEYSTLPDKGDVYIDCVPPEDVDRTTVEVYDHHERGSPYKSATEAVFEHIKPLLSNNELEAIENLVAPVNSFDAAKYPPKEFKSVTLPNIIAALHDGNVSLGKFWEMMETIFENLIRLEVSKIRAKSVPYMTDILNVVDQVDMKLKTYKIVSYEYDGIIPTAYLFFEEGAHFIVYVSQNNVGIMRNGILYDIHLEGLRNYINEDGWFFHKDGFIACRGSLKYPAATPSKYSIQDIVKILKAFVIDYHMQKNKQIKLAAVR